MQSWPPDLRRAQAGGHREAVRPPLIKPRNCLVSSRSKLAFRLAREKSARARALSTGKHMTSLGRVLAAAAAVTLVAAPAYAQRINSNAQGTFGQIQLRTGFTPDPHVVTVTAGG